MCSIVLLVFALFGAVMGSIDLDDWMEKKAYGRRLEYELNTIPVFAFVIGLAVFCGIAAIALLIYCLRKDFGPRRRVHDKNNNHGSFVSYIPAPTPTFSKASTLEAHAVNAYSTS